MQGDFKALEAERRALSEERALQQTIVDKYTSEQGALDAQINSIFEERQRVKGLQVWPPKQLQRCLDNCRKSSFSKNDQARGPWTRRSTPCLGSASASRACRCVQENCPCCTVSQVTCSWGCCTLQIKLDQAPRDPDLHRQQAHHLGSHVLVRLRHKLSPLKVQDDAYAELKDARRDQRQKHGPYSANRWFSQQVRSPPGQSSSYLGMLLQTPCQLADCLRAEAELSGRSCYGPDLLCTACQSLQARVSLLLTCGCCAGAASVERGQPGGGALHVPAAGNSSLLAHAAQWHGSCSWPAACL